MAIEGGTTKARRFRVDESGVAEFYRDGTPRRFIPWCQLIRVDDSGVHGAEGTRFRRFWLGGALLGSIFQEWRKRCPLAYREYRVRLHRRVRRSVFIYAPAMVLGPLIIFQVLAWLNVTTFRPDPALGRIRRGTIVPLLCLVPMWYFYFRWKRQGVYDPEGDRTEAVQPSRE
jgi:hypothetical protein